VGDRGLWRRLVFDDFHQFFGLFVDKSAFFVVLAPNFHVSDVMRASVGAIRVLHEKEVSIAASVVILDLAIVAVVVKH
jgi:hypothetical protein